MADSPPLVLAADLGGSRMRAAIVGPDGVVIHRREAPTLAERGRDDVIARLADLLAETRRDAAGAEVIALGLGVPGPVAATTGVLHSPPNLPGWRDVPLRDIIAERLGLPVYIGNDANLAAVGEWRHGAGHTPEPVDDLVYLTVSTGIGGGIISGGHLLTGADGYATEVGHMTIVTDGPRCSCGNCGCLEALASGSAIGRAARERVASGAESALLAMADGDIARIDAPLVAQAVAGGDAVATAVWRDAIEHLGIGVANLVMLANPRLVVIGGGVAQAGELLFEPLRRAVGARAWPVFTADLRIVPAALGDDSGIIGAAALVRQETQQTAGL